MELLIVIGIIGLLMGILIPALGKARAVANAVKCESNLRQLGIGFLMYTNSYKGYLPWTGNSDGNSIGNPIGPWDDSAFWANAIPKLLGRSSYYDLQQAALAGGAPLAKANDNNMFVCPSAGPASSLSSADLVNPDGTFQMYGNVAGSSPQYLRGTTPGSVEGRPVYWCYVINSKLDNSLQNVAGSGPVSAQNGFLKISMLRQAVLTVLIVEKLMQPGEISPPYKSPIARGKTTYTRFTGRHNNGGHLLMADGHVQWFSWAELQPVGNPPANNPAYNIPNKVIWDPFQRPLFN